MKRTALIIVVLLALVAVCFCEEAVAEQQPQANNFGFDPVVEEPKVEEEPKPAEEEPKPAEEEPKAAEEEAKAAEEEPKPAEEEPKAAEETVEEEVKVGVIVLGSKNFTAIDTGVWFVEFYAPWCSFCKNLEPTWNKLAIGVNNRWNIAKVDCTDGPEAIELCRKVNVKGFPTLKLFKDGKEVAQHNGPRDVRPFVDWVRIQLPEIEDFILPGEEPRDNSIPQEEIVSDVIALTDETINEIKNGETWVFAFTTAYCGYCIALAPAYEKFATLMKDKIKVARIDALANPKAVELYEVLGVPTIKMYTDGKLFDYAGSHTLEGLEKYVTDNVVKLRPKRDLPNTIVYEESGLANLHFGNFDDAIKDQDWLVYFYVDWCPHCKITSLIVNEFAEEKKINVGRVNIEHEIELRNRFKAYSVPTLLHFKANGEYGHFPGAINHRHFDLFIKSNTFTPPSPPPKREIVAVVADEASFHPEEDHATAPPVQD